MWKTEGKGWIINGVADVAREIDEKAFDACGAAKDRDERISVLGLGLGFV